MGLLFSGMTIGTTVTLVLFIGAWLLINEIARRSKLMSIVVFCVLPIVLAVLVAAGLMGSPTGKTWFGWVKVVSALIGVYGFLLIRHTSLGDKKFAALFPVSILSLNIAEAVYREFEVFATYKTLTTDAGGILIQGGGWNIFNAISGIFCIVTLVGFVGIRVSKDSSRDMVWPDMTWIYIVAYTLWNFAYVYNCISTRSMYAGFGILTAALIAELFFKQGVWLQHRAQILSVYAMFSLSIDYQAMSGFQIYPTYTPQAMWTISLVGFVFNLGAFAYMIFTARKQSKHLVKDEIYTDMPYYKKSMAVNNLIESNKVGKAS
jgi:hypothetical protein